jgi:hypothetical protein
LLYLVVGLISSVVSLGRLYITDQEVLTELVWAEDGLFPLCVANHGYWDCLWDPYAGYLLFLSRTLAVPVAYTPLDSWPLATNLVAAISYGAMSVLIYWLLTRIPVPQWAAAFAALVPVLLPIVGLEAVNTAGSLYMVLLVAAAIAVSSNFERPLPTWVLPTLLFVTALTIPVSLVLVFPLLVRYVRKTITKSQLLTSAAALVIGSALQFAVIIGASGQRPVNVTPVSVIGWIEGVATATGGLVGFSLDLLSTGQMSWPGDSINLPLGIALVLALTFVSLAMLRKPNLEAPSLLIASGLAMSAVPSILGLNNNRYYVTLSALVVIAIIIPLTTDSAMSPKIVAAVLAGALFILWIPSFPATEFRATPEPRWNYMLEEARARCIAEPERVDVVLRFTPVWPYESTPLGPQDQPLIAC